VDLNKHEPHFRQWESEMGKEPPQWSVKVGQVIGTALMVTLALALIALMVWGVLSIVRG
jgi:ABC-type dipeptide/oligopeptide/nickel transport system permease component